MSLTKQLRELSGQHDKTSWSPERFDLAEGSSRERLEARLESGAVREVADSIWLQLTGLMKERHPRERLGDDRLRALAEEHLGGVEPEAWGSWFFYPWSGRLVHVLPEAEYRELRTRRNCYKITPEEQAVLGEARIGIVGLSVGRTAAAVLALEGIGGELRLSDFDHLDLSNLNRLRSGPHAIGVNKAVLAAREVLEINPYLRVRIDERGVREETIDDLLLGGGRLSLLIEECDQPHIKLLIREHARAHGIPVVMDTSDRGLLDIERFDLEPDRPLFHGLIGDLTAAELKGLSTPEKVPILSRLIGADQMSLRMAASLPEIDHTITSWPQLASDVTLGGAITACAARRILLGQRQPSGRYYVDADEVLDSDGEAVEPWTRPPVSAEARQDRRPPALGRVETVDEAAVRTLVAWATLAPSPHNLQPWRFVARGDVIECWRDRTRALKHLEYRFRGADMSIGCAVESMSIAAPVMGLRIAIEVFPDAARPDLVARVRLAAGGSPTAVPGLAAHLAVRCTNRRHGSDAGIGDDALDVLRAEAAAFGATLHLVTDRESLREIGAIIGEADRQALLSRPFYTDLMGGLRWTAEEVEGRRDGLDVDTLELTGQGRAGMEILGRRPVVDEIGGIGRGEALADPAADALEATSAAALLVAPGGDPADYVTGGRALQRVWLAATRHDLAVHPWASVPFLLGRLEHGGDLPADLREAMTALAPRWHAVFGTAPGAPQVMFLRLSHADPPTALSLRRPLDDVLDYRPA